MKVPELIKVLSEFDGDTDVVIDGRAFFEGGQTQTKALRLIKGHMVCGPNDMTVGYFVNEHSAKMVMDDGKEFLDLT